MIAMKICYLNNTLEILFQLFPFYQVFKINRSYAWLDISLFHTQFLNEKGGWRRSKRGDLILIRYIYPRNGYTFTWNKNLNENQLFRYKI